MVLLLRLRPHSSSKHSGKSVQVPSAGAGVAVHLRVRTKEEAAKNPAASTLRSWQSVLCGFSGVPDLQALVAFSVLSLRTVLVLWCRAGNRIYREWRKRGFCTALAEIRCVQLCMLCVCK